MPEPVLQSAGTSESSEPGRVAIIGMAIRVPGAERDLDRFWSNIEQGVEATQFFERQNLLDMGVRADLVDRPNFVPARAVIRDADCFDGQLFGYSPQDSALMDPQQRVLLECSWSALEHAGYAPTAPEGNRVGVFGHRAERLPARQSVAERAGLQVSRRPPGDDLQRQGFRGHADRVQAEPSGPCGHPADCVLHLSGRNPLRGAEPAHLEATCPGGTRRPSFPRPGAGTSTSRAGSCHRTGGVGRSTARRRAQFPVTAQGSWCSSGSRTRCGTVNISTR